MIQLPLPESDKMEDVVTLRVDYTDKGLSRDRPNARFLQRFNYEVCCEMRDNFKVRKTRYAKVLLRRMPKIGNDIKNSIPIIYYDKNMCILDIKEIAGWNDK